MFTVEYRITTAACAADDNDTVNVAFTVPEFPSVTDTSLIEAVDAVSSSVIVPVACVSAPSVTFVPLLRLTVKVSVGGDS